MAIRRPARRLTMGLLALALGGAGPAVAAATTHTVIIEGMRFVPQTLTVHRGDRVVWINRDLFPHTATAGKAFDSHAIAANASWTHVARRAGSFGYVCSLHPGMKGTLVVQ
ncbi:MAG TPA: cupredoxin family copper-binding protein [Albitalea sp.]|nr:cupredoxin family copper-binding protein [Albitalea sp.]